MSIFINLRFRLSVILTRRIWNSFFNELVITQSYCSNFYNNISESIFFFQIKVNVNKIIKYGIWKLGKTWMSTCPPEQWPDQVRKKIKLAFRSFNRGNINKSHAYTSTKATQSGATTWRRTLLLSCFPCRSQRSKLLCSAAVQIRRTHLERKVKWWIKNLYLFFIKTY